MPYTVRRKFRKYGKGDNEYHNYNVYERAEADALGLEYVYWKKARSGDWALSDDGLVFECFSSKKYEIKKGLRKYYQWMLIFSLAASWDTKKVLEARLFLEDGKGIDRTHATGTTSNAHMLKRESFQKFCWFYAMLLLRSGRNKMAPEIELMAAQVYRPDVHPVLALKWMRHFVNDTDVIMDITDKMAQALQQVGMDRRYVLEKMKEMIDGTIKNKDFPMAQNLLSEVRGIIEASERQEMRRLEEHAVVDADYEIYDDVETGDDEGILDDDNHQSNGSIAEEDVAEESVLINDPYEEGT
jgi:hypothetical protein